MIDGRRSVWIYPASRPIKIVRERPLEVILFLAPTSQFLIQPKQFIYFWNRHDFSFSNLPANLT